MLVEWKESTVSRVHGPGCTLPAGACTQAAHPAHFACCVQVGLALCSLVALAIETLLCGVL